MTLFQRLAALTVTGAALSGGSAEAFHHRTVIVIREAPAPRSVDRFVEVPATRTIEVPVSRTVEVPVTRTVTYREVEVPTVRYVEVPTVRYVEAPVTRTVTTFREVDLPATRSAIIDDRPSTVIVNSRRANSYLR